MSVPQVSIAGDCVVGFVAVTDSGIVLTMSTNGGNNSVRYTVPAEWCRQYIVVEKLTSGSDMPGMLRVHFPCFDQPVMISRDCLKLIEEIAARATIQQKSPAPPPPQSGHPYGTWIQPAWTTTPVGVAPPWMMSSPFGALPNTRKNASPSYGELQLALERVIIMHQLIVRELSNYPYGVTSASVSAIQNQLLDLNVTFDIRSVPTQSAKREQSTTQP